jgi:N-acetylglutamate synthase-like GNAT family acetyltransferase
MTLTVRSFEDSDYDAVRATFLECEPGVNIGREMGDPGLIEMGQRYCAFQISQADLASAQALRETYSLDACERPRGNFFVLEDSATHSLAGQVGLECKGNDVGELRRMAVLPAYRNRKCGAQLVAALLHHATEQGLKRVMLTTLTVNTKGVRFYQANGFHVVREFELQTPYADAPISLVELAIDLRP